MICNGKELELNGTVNSIGIKEHDMVIVVDTTKKKQPKPAAQRSNNLFQNNGPVFYEGMQIEDVMQRNKNPINIVRIVQSQEYLMKQAAFHDKKLGELFRKDEKTAIKELRKHMMLNSAFAATRNISSTNIESNMQKKIAANPEDEEAKKYFKEKDRKQLIAEQYRTIMSEYPESMTRVLMLYINVHINKKPVQAFVDSGAQTSVISLSCAKRLELDHLIDERFSARMVGVGSAKSLGRIHLAPLIIEGNFFPITLTVLDDEKGLGDKNMDFLMGLDMLKRHSCNLDLVKGHLSFKNVNGQTVLTPFLHEKDLPEVKGGTKDYDPNNPDKNKPKEEEEN